MPTRRLRGPGRGRYRQAYAVGPPLLVGRKSVITRPERGESCIAPPRPPAGRRRRGVDEFGLRRRGRLDRDCRVSTAGSELSDAAPGPRRLLRPDDLEAAVESPAGRAIAPRQTTRLQIKRVSHSTHPDGVRISLRTGLHAARRGPRTGVPSGTFACLGVHSAGERYSPIPEPKLRQSQAPPRSPTATRGTTSTAMASATPAVSNARGPQAPAKGNPIQVAATDLQVRMDPKRREHEPGSGAAPRNGFRIGIGRVFLVWGGERRGQCELGS